MNAKLRKAVLAVLAASHPAYAQQAVEKVERIEITGSRIAASSDIDSASPVAVIKAEDIKMEGFSSIELVLNNYPQFFADQGNRISNGATGTATANLRALGPQRTLVLMNGKRMPASSPFVLAPDLNQVPPALIQRVEVLTGGASAVYGSDAVAGVVNFILNDHFEGVQGDVSYDFYNHRQGNAAAAALRAHDYPIPGDKTMDGATTTASLTMGGNFAKDKGNATMSFRYFKSEALQQSERDYSACALNLDGNGNAVCGGSPTGYPGRFVNLGAVQPDFTTAVQNLTIATATGSIRNYRSPADDYNFAPLNYYQRPQERYGFNALANYEVAPEARVYAEFGYHDDHTRGQISPSGLFGVETFVRWENPLLSDDWRARLLFLDRLGNPATGPGSTADVVVYRRNIDGGARFSDMRLTSFRDVLGVKGALASHWDYDAFFQAGKVLYSEEYFHDFSKTRASRALDVVADPTTGAPVCASVLSGTDRNCVPYNIWALNGATPAAVAYLEVPGFRRATMSQQVMGGTVSANLGDYGIRLPRTREGIEVAFGVERRTEKLDFEVDAEYATGDLAGQGQFIPVEGAITVKEIFGEVRVPILDVLNLSGSFRRSDYSTGFATDTFGVGFNAAPSRFARVRGSYQRAVRAPDLLELFSPQGNVGYDLGSDGDPCAGQAPARSLADCRRTGVTAATYGRILVNPDTQFPATAGGNTGLKAETATTYTIGLVLAPSKDLSVTVDYFDVRIEDTISAIDPGVILQQCLDTGNPFFCSLIARDPATGTLWRGTANIIAIAQNIGKTRIAGTDISFNYRLRLPRGHNVAFDGMGTYLHNQSIQLYPGALTSECAGQFETNCSEVPLPRWRHRLRATWQPPMDMELAATWRHINGTSDPSQSGLPLTELPSVNYVDIAGSWHVSKSFTLRGGINNVADRDPPLNFGGAPHVNGNAFAQVYDVLGRHVFVSLTAKF